MMSDFIAEFRPKCQPKNQFNDVVFKPKPNIDLNISSPMTLSDMPQQKPTSYHTNEDVLSFVSQKQFSKSQITTCLNSSIISLVEKFLAGRLIARISGHIEVSLCHDDLPISVSINEVYGDDISQSDPLSDFNIKLRQDGELHGEKEKPVSPDSSMSEKSRPNFLISDFGDDKKISELDKTSEHQTKSLLEGSFLSVPRDECRRRDSDVESGYNSSPDSYCYTRKSSDCGSEIGGNDMSSLEKIRWNKNDENEDEEAMESRLVIDLSEDASCDDTAISQWTESKCNFSEMTSETMSDPEQVYEDDISESSCTLSENNERIDAEEGDHQFENAALTTSLSKELVLSDNEEPNSSDDVTDTENEVNRSSPTSEISDKTIKTFHPQSMVLEHSSGKVICKICNTTLTDAKEVSKHALEEHNLHSCSICFRTFTAKNNMKRHLRLHTGLRPYKCPHCPLTFARRDDMKGHKLRHDYNKPYRCAICKKGYTDRACVKNHMVKEHGSQFMHFCPQCGESFDNHEDFSAHKKTHPELEMFSCKECYFIGNNTLMTMKHSLIHKFALFSCKPCNAFYSDPFDYTNHLRKHKRDESFRSYTCCFCKLNLTSYDQFVRHEYSHAQGKLYSCKICKKQFKGKILFQEHSMTHKVENQSPKNENTNDTTQETCTSHDVTQADNCRAEDELMDKPDQPVSNMAIDMDCHDSVENNHGALDLSMKKPIAIMEMPKLEFVSEAAFTPTTKESASVCVPRDGCTPESVVTMFESKTTDDEIIEIKDDVPEQRNSLAFEGAHQEVSLTKRKEFQQSYRQHELRKKILSHIERGHASMGPYRQNPHVNREKYVDFFSKLQAARGGFLTRQNSQQSSTIPSAVIKGNEIIHSIDSRDIEHPSIHPAMSGLVFNKETGQLQINALNSPLQNRTNNQNVQTLSDDSIYNQLPTFIKTEDIHDIERRPELTPFNQPSSPYSPFSTSPFITRDTPSSNHVEKTEAVKACHSCDSCKEMFFSFRELEAHCVSVHKRYPCKHCNKTFTARPNRDRHARFHTGERPYKCDLCHQAFHRGDDLKYHRTTRHASTDRQSCRGCAQTFTWGKDLQRHLRNGNCCA